MISSVFNVSFVSKIMEKVILWQLLSHVSPNSAHFNLHTDLDTALRQSCWKLCLTFCILLTMQTHLFLVCLTCQLPLIQYTVPFFSNVLNMSLALIILLFTGSFLTSQTELLTVNNCSSATVLISCRVPQGSALGPVLFVVCTASVSDAIDSHCVLHHSFADDT